MVLKTVPSQRLQKRMTVSHQLLQQGQRAAGLFPAIELVTLGHISGQCHICGNVFPGVLVVGCQTLAVDCALKRNKQQMRLLAIIIIISFFFVLEEILTTRLRCSSSMTGSRSAEMIPLLMLRMLTGSSVSG